MKDRVVIDFGQMMDEFFEATQNFGDAFKHGFSFNKRDKDGNCHWNENVDYYPKYSYPPANVYLTQDREMVLEFALAGFAESEIDLQFVGDYLVLNAKAPARDDDPVEVRYFKRKLKLKDIEDQKYYVPEDKFDRENVRASYKHGLLTVHVPSREPLEDVKDSVKVNIVVEDDDDVTEAV